MTSPKGGFPGPLSPDPPPGRYRRRIVTAKIEDIFLVYANNSLRDNPEILYDIIKSFTNLESIEVDLKWVSSASGETSKIGCLTAIIKYFVELVKCDDLQTAIKMRDTQRYIDDMHFQTAFQAVFGYADGYCEDEAGCGYNNQRQNALEFNRFNGPERIKCYECDQLFFRHMLDGIVKGKEYFEIDELPNLLMNANHHFNKRVLIVSSSSDSPFKETLQEKIIYIPIFTPGGNNKLSFRNIFLWDIVAYSLCGFLFKNDRRKLKKCDWCSKFAVGKRLKVEGKNSFCSTNCKEAFHRDRRKKEKYHTRYMKEYRKL